MFLFTTPPARETAPTSPVVDAIRRGAERSGTAFDYLLSTAQRESSLDPKARAPTSSALGLFQFIEQTWLGLVKGEGAKLGLGNYAAAVKTRADGTHAVDDPALRREILALREDPGTAAIMAGLFTQRNRDVLAADLGREPRGSDLYVAHVLGARGAADLIRTAQVSPNRPAASDFPQAAAANRTIFYDRAGRARGAGEVYALLAASHAPADGATAAPAFAPERPLGFASSDGPSFHGLFQTDTRRGPISESVARLWRSGSDRPQAQTAALGSAFFPRSTASTAKADPKPAAEAGIVDVPLPPARPAKLRPPASGRAAAAPPRSGPLDLGAFMRWRKS